MASIPSIIYLMRFLTMGPTIYEVTSIQRLLLQNYVVSISSTLLFTTLFDLVNLDLVFIHYLLSHPRCLYSNYLN